MQNGRPHAPLERLCRRAVDHLRRDCLIALALQMRGHHGTNAPLRREWELAKTEDERRRVADALAHLVNATLEQVAVFVDVELMQRRLRVVVEPAAAETPYELAGDDLLRIVLGPMLFDADRDKGETSAGEQLYDLVTSERPVFGRADEASKG
jgi:hypothetical protein